jgi:hypothetical protein
MRRVVRGPLDEKAEARRASRAGACCPKFNAYWQAWLLDSVATIQRLHVGEMLYIKAKGPNAVGLTINDLEVALLLSLGELAQDVKVCSVYDLSHQKVAAAFIRIE